MSHSEQLQSAREYIRSKMSTMPGILESEPIGWWRLTARKLLTFRSDVLSYPDAGIREYFLSQIDLFLHELCEVVSTTPTDSEDYASLADHMIMKFSMEIAKPFEKIEEEVVTNHVSLSELVRCRPDRFYLSERVVRGEDCVILHVKHPIENKFQEIPLPKRGGVWHKGGPARAVLDILVNAPVSMQISEFPWNDFDAVVADRRRYKRAALNIGVDADGIEYMGGATLDFPRYCAGRDTTQNQVCLGVDGLFYSSKAYETAVTGHTRIENEYVANKAIYGFDKMTIHGETVAKPRGLMRLIKAVVEGKALSFDYLPLNSNLDLATHSLFLAKRWSKKENFHDYLDKMYFLMGQMGQLRLGENEIFATLDRVHSEYPFFDFLSEVRTPTEVVRWKAKKLIKQIDREMGWKFQIPTGLKIYREPGDDIPKRISLDGYTTSVSTHDYSERWSAFLLRSDERTKLFQATDNSPYTSLFGHGQLDEESSFLEREEA